MTGPISDALLANIHSAIEAHAKDDDTSVYDALKQDDALLKSIIPYFKTPHDRPATPHTGSAEFGVIPYWLAHPDQIPLHQLIPDKVMEIIQKMEEYGLVPPPTITPSEYNDLINAVEAGKAIGPDGTVYGFAEFEQLNYKWIACVVNGLLTKYLYHKADFGPDFPNPIPISDDCLTFAVAGDWGTAATGALDVRQSIEHIGPDYLIHLGDVYYTGTPNEGHELLYWGHGTETKNLMEFWPKSLKPGRSFTMNSNHEMYPGAHGLFQDALSPPDSVFSAMQKKNYFLLENSNWQIFGLDSAFDSPDFMYMYGAITQQQLDFISQYHNPDKKLILMTHHTPYDLTGQKPEEKHGVCMLEQIKTAFGKMPNYWYFGHIHDGIVYAEKDGCKMRCTGHASMPYGAPWGLVKPGAQPPYTCDKYIDGIEFFACTPINKDDPAGQVKNGFMTFTLDAETLTEAFFDDDCTQTWPVTT